MIQRSKQILNITSRPTLWLTACLVLACLLLQFVAALMMGTTHHLLLVSGLSLVSITFIWQVRTTLNTSQQRQHELQDTLRHSEQELLTQRYNNARLLHQMEQEVARRTASLEQTNRELIEANTQLEAFNYMVSHDMSASLRVMDGFTKLLTDEIGTAMTPAIRHDLDRIHTATHHLQNMVQELLKLSRTNNALIARQVIDLSATAKDIVQELQITDPQRNIEVEIAADVLAFAEPSLLREVLQNLLSNAWKFTARSAGAHIKFGILETEVERIYYVQDNGVGFDMNRNAELFKPFHRLHSRHDFEGTGVGLAVVKRIVERHGGRVWAEGRINQGARFCFSLAEPLHEAPRQKMSRV